MEDPAAGENLTAVLLYGHCRLTIDAQIAQPRRGLRRCLHAVVTKMKLFRHHGRDAESGWYLAKLQQTLEYAWSIKCLPTNVLVDETRLLSKSRGKYQRGISVEEAKRFADDTIHLLVPVQDCRLELALLAFARLNR